VTRHATAALVASFVLLLASSPALAREAADEPAPLRLEPASASSSTRPAARRPLELALAAWRRCRTRAEDELAPSSPSLLGRGPIVLELDATAERISRGPASTRLDGMAALSDVLDELPLLGRAWTLAAELVAYDAELLRSMTLELGGDSFLPSLLRDFGGALARGPYVRQDDANGTAITIDVRLVLAWRPGERVHLEAGYAIAYAAGEYGRQLDGSPGHRGEFLRHGPWAGVGFDF
jgi:hypothetical protein